MSLSDTVTQFLLIQPRNRDRPELVRSLFTIGQLDNRLYTDELYKPPLRINRIILWILESIITLSIAIRAVIICTIR